MLRSFWPIFAKAAIVLSYDTLSLCRIDKTRGYLLDVFIIDIHFAKSYGFVKHKRMNGVKAPQIGREGGYFQDKRTIDFV